MLINQPATEKDCYDGGLHIERDASLCTGGTHGSVNTALYSHTVAGKDLEQFEWNILGVMDNYADKGENCGAYFQANKHGSGPTWGACIEACDTTPGDSTGLVGLEADCWVSGQDNGQRIGIDIVIGDSRLNRGLSQSDTVQGTAGLRISSSSNSPHAVWSKAIDTTLANTPVALQTNFNQAIKCGPINLLWLCIAAMTISTIAICMSVFMLVR